MNKELNRDKELPFLTHLEELQKRVIRCILAIGGGTAICYFYTEKILEILKKPLGENLVFLSPQEGFVTALRIAVFGGILLALPFIFYEVWKFISLALKKDESKYFLIYVPLSAILFLVGCAFSYFIILPIGLKFLLGFAGDYLKPMISVERYVYFVALLLLGFGVMFELPLITTVITRAGLVSPHFLTQKRKVIIVSIFIIAALFTPPDIFTQVLMAGPLIILFEISIWLSKIIYKKYVEPEE